MPNASGYVATASDVPLSPIRFDRREVGERDVKLEILHCGVCHSDLHMARDEWGRTPFPIILGHEIVGRVTAVGAQASRFAAGDLVGVGPLVDSCRRCGSCAEGLEQYCEEGVTEVYGSVEKQTGKMTAGGYSDSVVVDEDFVLRLGDGVDLAGTAPLLCAGVTTYSPLRHWQVGPGSTVGVVGLGGLGHMGVKLAAAMGAEVVLFTTSPAKAEDAIAMGAGEVVLSSDAEAMRGRAASIDLIIDTVAAAHDLDPYLETLARDGTLTLVGVPAEPHPSPSPFLLLGKRRSLAGSAVGGIAETQEMLDFCAEHGIAAEVEPIAIDEIDDAYDRMERGEVRYRFVIDMATLRA